MNLFLQNLKVNQRINGILKILIIVCVSILFLELFLRLTIGFLPSGIQNIILSNFTILPSGIYFRDLAWDMHIMKPDREQKVFYNTYRWLHKTNKIGIRDNRNLEKADIIVLGDSMVYGHGVEEDGTFCSILEKETGFIVANLGVQGDYPPYQYIRLKHLGLFFKPKIAFFFINENDLVDFKNRYPTSSFIKKIIAEKSPNYTSWKEMVYLRDNNKINIVSLSHNIFIDSLYSTRLFYGMMSILKDLCMINIQKSSNYITDTDLIADIMGQILYDAKQICDLNTSKFVVVFNPTKEKKIYDICKKTCLKHKIDFLDLNNKDPQKNYFLKNDGHYSIEGNRWVAECLVEYISKNKRAIFN